MYGSIPTIMAVEKTGVISFLMAFPYTKPAVFHPGDAHLPGWISWRASWNASMAGLTRCQNGSPAMGRTAIQPVSHRSWIWFLVVGKWRKKMADIFKTPPIIRRDLGFETIKSPFPGEMDEYGWIVVIFVRNECTFQKVNFLKRAKFCCPPEN